MPSGAVKQLAARKAVGGGGPSFETVAADLSPTHWWKLDEASGSPVNSGSAGTFTLTPTGTLTYSQPSVGPGIKGDSVLFGGGHFYNAGGPFSGTNPAVSVGAWIQTTASAQQYVAAQRSPGGSGYHNTWVLMVAADGTVRAWGYDNDAYAFDFDLTSTLTVNDGNPHFIGFARNTGETGRIDLYVDGVSEANTNGSTYAISVDREFAIGYDRRDSESAFSGHIQHVIGWQGSTIGASDWLAMYEAGV